MKFRMSIAGALVSACALGTVAAHAQSSASAGSTGSSANASSAGGSVASTRPMHTQSMQRLQEASDRLRQSIQSLAQKPPGEQRDRAIAETHEALMRTQQAMMSLPPELRSSGTVSAGYDASVKKLMKSADSLRQAIQEMAQQPAGERRNQAIQQANRALWDAQSAMVAAYQPGGSTQAMGAASSDTRSSGAAASDSKGQQGGRNVTRSATSPSPAAVLVLLPTAQAQNQRLADGCWVRFFDDKDFKGDTLTLAGPVDLPKMELGNVWRDWESAIVGPKATVRTFDNENFNDRTAMLKPGQKIADLGDQKLGWFEEVKSARVACS